MKKYRFFVREYVYKIFFLTFLLILIMFFQLGFKKNNYSLKDSYVLMLSNIFISIHFLICLLLFDNYKRSILEIIRIKNIFISFFERLIITILMVIIIRIMSSLIYSLIIYHNVNNYKFIFRFIYIDICNIIISYTLFNFVKNKYVSFIVSVSVCVLLYTYKWLHFAIIKTNGEKFVGVNFFQFIWLIIYLILFIVSVIWRCENVND